MARIERRRPEDPKANSGASDLLAEMLETLAAAVEFSPNAIIVVGDDGTILLANSRVGRRFG